MGILPNLLIRADALTDTGTGHLMRCLALAQAWRAQSGKVFFLSHCMSRSLRERVESEKIDLLSVERIHPDPYDISYTLATLESFQGSNESETWFVLDGYHFDPSYQRTIRESGNRLLVIDDFNIFPYYYADIIVNQNINAGTINYQCNPEASLLLGSRYILLRQEFRTWQNWERVIPEKAEKVLVTLGGSDTRNVTLKVIRALQNIKDSKLLVTIVLGGTNPHVELIRHELSTFSYRYNLLTSVQNMPELMAWADIAISTVGSTCWELAFMGLPTLLLVTQENHKFLAKQLEDALCFKSLFLSDDMDKAVITESIEMLIGSREILKIQSEKGKQLIDGKGVDRIMKKMTVNQCS